MFCFLRFQICESAVMEISSESPCLRQFLARGETCLVTLKKQYLDRTKLLADTWLCNSSTTPTTSLYELVKRLTFLLISDNPELCSFCKIGCLSFERFLSLRPSIPPFSLWAVSSLALKFHCSVGEFVYSNVISSAVTHVRNDLFVFHMCLWLCVFVQADAHTTAEVTHWIGASFFCY